MTTNILEPLAIIGIGCRFPGGAHNPSLFWDLLINAKDAIVEIPITRWNKNKFYDSDQNKPGKMYMHAGGFLQDPIDRFDALFFGISPREAACLDPQQRLLLEVAWESMEDAGIPPITLAGTNTGVYIGGFIIDSVQTHTGYFNRNFINTHTAVSFTHTMLSNRLSYVFDLRGPSITIDTACSSSLVALHQAAQSIWRGECSLALVGGVNIMHRPETMITMCKSQLLALDGHSKSFDARGDGYGRGEGAGIVILKPLTMAQHDGDNVYALIRATGSNQDGRTNGITVPNGEAQQDLIRKVLSLTGLNNKQIYYVEAHGTGTEVGDPIECKALGAALGQGRNSDNACWVGSVKANIGHLEAAAGVASIIKTALVLQHNQIPPVAGLQTLNPNIPFAELGLRIPRQVEPIFSNNEPIYAAINSFGYGGTNAHAILQQFPLTAISSAITEVIDAPITLLLSARNFKALQSLAKSYIELLSQDNAPSLRDICWSAATRREHHRERLSLVIETKDKLLTQLHDFSTERGKYLLHGTVVPDQAEHPVFVFTGMGPQWWGMGRELLKCEPIFLATAEVCDKIFQNIAGWSILEAMRATEADSKIGETQIAQPANFVLQASLAALWRSLGIKPAAVIGHSVGDVTAAYESGVLSLEDAICVSYHRSRIQKKAAGQGKMLAVNLTA